MLIRTIKHLQRPGLLSGAFALVALGAWAQEADFVTSPLVMQEYGIFCPRVTSGRREAPGTERGFIDLVEGEVHPDFSGTIVPGELGIGFGIRFRMREGAGSSDIQVLTIHPPMGNPPVTVESYTSTVWDDDDTISLFTFDDEYEIQYGEWVFVIELAGEPLLRKTFTVVPPEDTLIGLDLCQGPALMS